MSPKIDQLTGIANRRAFFESIEVANNPIVALVNINRFRDINSLYGFDSGDHLLMEFAHFLERQIGKCKLFRISGDQFVILDDSADAHEFVEFLESLQNSIKTHIFLENSFATHIRTTIGVAVGADQALTRAEGAQKEALEKRVSMVVSKEIDREKSQANLKMITLVKQAALQPWWVVPLFQPIVDTATGRVVKYEALMRLKDSSGKLYTPFHFLDLAKHSRYYIDLTKAMVRNSLAQFIARSEEITLNLAVEDILSADVMEFVRDEIASFGNASQITLEITESDEIENYQKVIDSLAVFKEMGAKIAIDDFGSGYSNFAYLIQFQADFLKIDGSIVQKIVEDEKSYLTLCAIVDFAKRMGIKTIAEFVSNADIADKTKQAGVDFWQGYHLGAPALLG